MHLNELQSHEFYRDPPTPLEEDLLYLHCSLASSRSSDGRERIVHLLHYLECFPLGAHNRVIAQKIEDLLYQGEFLDHERSALRARYRALRDPYMPAIVERLDFG